MCSGIEGASVAWEPLGWSCAGVAEIDPFASAVLAHRFPAVTNHGDFTKIGATDLGAVDLLVGGTPCQDFSVAGLRAGLAGDRGRLTVEFVRLLERLRPRWFLWENVPGVLSADRGRAFGIFLGALGKLGYGFAYRVLDAQYFGVPQRRRRVFVVGYLGDWRPPAAVLFERESLLGHPAPSREAWKDVAGALSARATAGGGFGTDFELDGGIVVSPSSHAVYSVAKTTGPLRSNHGVVGPLAGSGAGTARTGNARTEAAMPVTARNGDPGCVAFTCKDDGRDVGHTAPTLRALGHDKSNANGGGQVAIAFALRGREAGNVPEIHGDGSTIAALRAASGGSTRDLPAQEQVRRLTPRECERLQGFPDDWTLVPYRKKPAADGPRYRALGNSFAVPVIRWLGDRIAIVDAEIPA